MKNIVKKSAYLFLTFYIGIGFLLSVHAQQQDRNIERLIEALKPIEYDYYVGTKVGFALLRQCVALSGSIIEADASKVTFSIEEKLFGENFDKTSIQLNYKKPFLKPASATPSTWAYVDINKGKELIVFYCEKEDRAKEGQYTYITSDKSLFPSIKESIKLYADYQRQPELLLNVPNLVKSRADRVLLGSFVELLSKRGGAINTNNYILVISRLLETDIIPEKYAGSLESVLVHSLSGSKAFPLGLQIEGLPTEIEVYPISSETRKKSFEILVNMATGDKKLTGESIRILAQIANANAVNLMPYLNQKNKVQILSNLKTLPKGKISQKEREEFEKLLINN